jgi:hypothetical protein
VVLAEEVKHELARIFTWLGLRKSVITIWKADP